MEGYWNAQTLGSSFFCNSFQHWNDIIAWMRTYETRYNLSFSKNNAGDKREGGEGEGEGGGEEEEKKSFQKRVSKKMLVEEECFLFSFLEPSSSLGVFLGV